MAGTFLYGIYLLLIQDILVVIDCDHDDDDNNDDDNDGAAGGEQCYGAGQRSCDRLLESQVKFAAPSS